LPRASNYHITPIEFRRRRFAVGHATPIFHIALILRPRLLPAFAAFQYRRRQALQFVYDAITLSFHFAILFPFIEFGDQFFITPIAHFIFSAFLPAATKIFRRFTRHYAIFSTAFFFAERFSFIAAGCRSPSASRSSSFFPLFSDVREFLPLQLEARLFQTA
jgi:hypothetical protein